MHASWKSVFHRAKDDDILDVQQEMISDFSPMKVCRKCKEAIAERRKQLVFLLKMAETVGLNEVIVKDFIRSLVLDHDDSTLVLLSGFIAGVAMRKYSRPKRAAKKLILGIMRGANWTLEKVEKAITGEATEMACQWHNSADPLGLADEQGDEEGQLPPDSQGPSMFG